MSEQQGIDDGTESGGRRARLRERIGSRPGVRSAALVGSGPVVGGILAGAVAAGAADLGSGGSASGEDARGAVEEALTGDTADQLEEFAITGTE